MVDLDQKLPKDKNNKIVSVLMCTHNAALFLAEQLNSILDSSYPIRQIFVFDWASVDQTREILKNYEKIDPKIVVFEQDYAPGPAVSFMRAIEQLTSCEYDWDFLALSDQDDVWDRDKLQYQMSEISDRSGTDIVYTNTRIFSDEVNNNYPLSSHFGGGSYYKYPLNCGNDYSIFFSNPAIGMTMLLSRAICEKATDIYDKCMNIMHDWFLMQVATIYDFSIVCLPRSTVSYRQHGNNILGAQKKKSVTEKIVRAKGLVICAKKQLNNWNDLMGVRSYEFSLLKTLLLIAKSEFLSTKGKLVLCVSYLIFFKRGSTR